MGFFTGSALLLLGIAVWRLVRQRRECRFQSKVIAATGCGVVMTDARVPHYPVTHVNPAFRLLTGYSDSEIVGKTMAILAGPGTDRASVEKLELALQQGRACRVCLLHYRKDGTPFLNEITLSPVKGRTGRLTAMVWVMIDVTRCREAERVSIDAPDQSRHHGIARTEAHQESARSSACFGRWERDIRTGVEIWSDEQCRMFGYEPGRILPTYDTFKAAIHPEDRGRVLDAGERSLALDEPFDVECRIVQPSGNVRTVHFRGLVIRNLAGEPIRFLGIVQDQTAGALLDKSAKEQNLLFRQVVEYAPNGLLMVGQDGVISMVNTQIESMFGYSHDELLGLPVETLFCMHDRVTFEMAREKALSTAVVHPMGHGMELCGLRHDGSEFPVEIGLNPVAMASGTSLLVAVIDITARCQAEGRLRESEERLDLAVRTAQVGIFEHDHQADTLYWSPVLRSIYGVSADEPGLLQRYIELVHESDREKVFSAVKEAHDPAGNGQFHLEHRIVRPDGEVRHISLNSRTWFNGEGAAPVPSRTLGIVIDITDRKKVEASLRIASKMTAISTLSGGIAHEFNNSLTAVLGFSHLALPLIPNDNKAHHYVQQVLSAGMESRELVHQLLTFSRQSEQVRHPLPLHLLVKEAIKPLRAGIPSSIKLKEQIDASTSPVLADTAQMHQMIMNLADNAIHAMRKTGGILAFHLQDKEIKTDQITPSGRLAAGRYACLTVRDSGEGMEPAVADRIFEPFFSGKPLGEGRGMGLSVVHGIVTAHGGTVVIDSQIDVGTVVSVYIPALSRSAASVPVPDNSLPRGRECILFVAAEESFVTSGQKMLESLGYRLIILTSGTAAWQAFDLAPQRVDLLIADLTLPDMSADRLAHRCRQLRPDLPVILCVGSEQALFNEDNHMSGIVDIAPKPLTVQDLAHRIRRVLDARSAACPPSTELSIQSEERSQLSREGFNAVSSGY
ncbi:MAG: PAS domain S-box protein [Nitrospira sp.]|nr:PAS domain S-box protein [Nitrospira sp.]